MENTFLPSSYMTVLNVSSSQVAGSRDFSQKAFGLRFWVLSVADVSIVRGILTITALLVLSRGVTAAPFASS